MPYTTYQKIEDDVTLGGLRVTIPKVDGQGETIIPATIDTDRIDRIMETVTNAIDGMIGQRYVVPLALQSSINVVEWICRALTICQIYHKESGGPEWRQEDCVRAQKALEDIADGKTDIPGATVLDSRSAQLCNPYDAKYKELTRPIGWPDQSWASNDSDSSFMRDS